MNQAESARARPGEGLGILLTSFRYAAIESELASWGRGR